MVQHVDNRRRVGLRCLLRADADARPCSRRAPRTHELEGVAESADDAGKQRPVAVGPVLDPGADAGLGHAERRVVQERDIQDERQDEEPLQMPISGPEGSRVASVRGNVAISMTVERQKERTVLK